jgi:hypothetical protein
MRGGVNLQAIKNNKEKLLVGTLLALVLVLGLGYAALAQSGGTVTVKFLDNVTGILLSGGTLTLEAIAPNGYEFDHWEVNGQDAGSNNPLTITMDEDKVIEAVFVKAVVEVSIDIKPGSDPNSINPKSKGKIPVAILSTPDFDAPSEVDRDSLTSGCTGDEDSLAFCNPSPEDVNDDGYYDLVCHFYTQSAGFECGDELGYLKGQIVDGVPIEGNDSVRIVPCK